VEQTDVEQTMEEVGWRLAPNQSAQEEITRMREAIDTLDETIATLLAQRLTLSCRIGAVKAVSDLNVKDHGREQEVISNVRATAPSTPLADALTTIYKSVIGESCKLQKSIKEAANKPTTQVSNIEANSTVYFPRVLIVGMGMIGGAIASQIKRVMPETNISAVDKTDVLEAALNAKLIDKAESDLNKAVAHAGLILLCATPAENLRLLKQIAPLTKRRQVIMDVTSTKQEICDLAEQTPMRADFVGGHPLFGSHKSGVAAARDVEVDGKRFCLVPTSRSSELTMRRLARWLSDLGMQVLQTPAIDHDLALAQTSHIVQLMAVALGNSLAHGRSADQLSRLTALSGPSLQSLSRLMSSPPDMWLEIAQQNKLPIAQALTLLIEELRATRIELTNDNHQALRRRFAEAARVNESI
jgi:prephenate dehydrogenase